MVLALGIFGFCVVVILGLLGSVMTSSRESWMETRAAQIARQITQDLTPDPAGNTNSTTRVTPLAGILVTVPDPVQINLAPASATTNTGYYSAEGIAVAPGATNLLFRADVIITPITLEAAVGALPERKVSQLRIDIRPEAQTNAQPFRFLSRIATGQSTP
jgi:hypothetical protein